MGLLGVLGASQDLEIWSPAPGSVTSERAVDLGFNVVLPDEVDANLCELCVFVGDERLLCEALAVLLTEQLQLLDLLPGRRVLRLALSAVDVASGARTPLAEATAAFVVGANPSSGRADVDITAARAAADPWRSAVPGAASASGGREAYFGAVYDTKFWSARGSMAGVPGSGPGSTVAAGANAIAVLEALVRELGLATVLDVPCGDMTWMARADLGRARYVGADIVRSVVEGNARDFGHPRRTFLHLDVADGASAPAALRAALGGDADAALVLCRHLLFHLPPRDGEAVLDHLRASGARWLLTSTYLRADDLGTSDDFVLASGHKTNLLRPPYCARDPERLYRDAPDTDDQYLGLWDLAKGPVLGPCDADDPGVTS